VLLLFGAGKLPRVMGDFAKGIKAFKAGMKDEEEEAATSPDLLAKNNNSRTTSTGSTAQPEHAAHDRG
jgi:sec-independent protein translocase protein TatA